MLRTQLTSARHSFDVFDVVTSMPCALPVTSPACRFRDYAHMMAEGVMAKHGAVEHWAKIEVPSRAADLEDVRARLAARYR